MLNKWLNIATFGLPYIIKSRGQYKLSRFGEKYCKAISFHNGWKFDYILTSIVSRSDLCLRQHLRRKAYWLLLICSCVALLNVSARISGSKASIFPACDDVSFLRLHAPLYLKTSGFFFTEGRDPFSVTGTKIVAGIGN